MRWSTVPIKEIWGRSLRQDRHNIRTQSCGETVGNHVEWSHCWQRAEPCRLQEFWQGSSLCLICCPKTVGDHTKVIPLLQIEKSCRTQEIWSETLVHAISPPKHWNLRKTLEFEEMRSLRRAVRALWWPLQVELSLKPFTTAHAFERHVRPLVMLGIPSERFEGHSIWKMDHVGQSSLKG